MDFISTDPALASYYSTRNNERAETSGDIQLRDQQQTEGANNAIDAGLRQWFQGGGQQPQAQPTAPSPAPATPAPVPAGNGVDTSGLGNIGGAPAPATAQAAPAPIAAPQTASPANGALSTIGQDTYAPTYGRIAQTPGTGRFLLGMDQQGQQQKQAATYRMFDAMDKGDVPQAQFIAGQLKFSLPPGAWNDARTVRTLGQAKYFMPMYAGDEQRFGQFLSTALRGSTANGGTPDWQGALAAIPPRSGIEAKVSGATAAMGHAPSDAAIEAMAGGRMPYQYGAPVPVQNPDGTTGYEQPNRRGGAPRQMTGPDGQPIVAGARPAAIRPPTGATQGDKDWTSATNSVNGDPLYMTKQPQERNAEIQRRYDALKSGRERNNTSARPASVVAPRVDQGPASVHAGTQQDPHQPMNESDFAAIQPGQVFIDPGDGKPYRKRP